MRKAWQSKPPFSSRFLKFWGGVFLFIGKMLAAGFWAGMGFWLAFALVLSWFANAHAAERIPAAALKYRSEIIRAARVEAGLDAPVALFAAQVEQESGWNPQAVSPVGARGLGQFMPATAKDLGRTRPDLGPAIPTNPGWALRALVAYDLQLVRLVRAATVCDTWAMGITAYNEGIGNIWKEQTLAKRQGLDPGLWEDVKKVNAGRSLAAFHESRSYWPGIQRRQPKYLILGPGILCEVAR